MLYVYILLPHMLLIVYESLLYGEQVDDTISSLNAQVENLSREEELTLHTSLIQDQEEQGHSLQVDGEEGGEKWNKTALLPEVVFSVGVYCLPLTNVAQYNLFSSIAWLSW